jgi:hypothetical protein
VIVKIGAMLAMKAVALALTRASPLFTATW